MALLEAAHAGLTRLNPYSLYIKLGLEAVALLGAGGLGWHLHNVQVYKPHLLKDAKQDLAELEKVHGLELTATKISTKWQQQATDSREHINVTTRETIRDIPVYIPAKATMVRSPAVGGPGASDTLPAGLVRLLDYSAQGKPAPATPTPGLDLTGPSGVSLPQAAGVLIGNNGDCLSWRSELLTWRGWYRDLDANWGSKK